jgi:mannose-6-phosphate isomerase-like protein (cupin superfamily)
MKTGDPSEKAAVIGGRTMLACEGGVHVGPGEGRSVRVLSSQLEVKAAEKAGLSFGMFQSSFPPGTGMPFLHLHRSYEEAFYVLQGEVQFQLGAHEIRATAGSAVLVPAGVPHCFRNVGPGNVEWIVVAAPARAVTAIEEVGQVAPGDLDGLAEIFERHDSELLERHPHWHGV